MDIILEKIRQIIKKVKHNKTISIGIILLIAAAIPLTVFIAEQQQDIRQRAQVATVSCSPRPNVNQTVALAQPGMLAVTISATNNAGSSGNVIKGIRFSSFSNVTVVLNDKEYTQPIAVEIPPVGTQVFYIKQTTLGQPGTAQYFVIDECGEFSKFAGAGVDGWGNKPLTLTVTPMCNGTTSQFDLNFNNTSGHIYSIESNPSLISSQIPGVLTNRPLRLPFGTGIAPLTPGASYSIYIQDHTDNSIKSNTVTAQALNCAPTPTLTPTPIPACTPRPNVDQTVTLKSTGILNVTVTAKDNTGRTDNVIKGIKVTAMDNVLLYFPDNKTDKAPFDYTVANPQKSLTFEIRGIDLAKGGTAQYKVIDNCGEFDKFAGAGVNGWGVTPTSPPTLINLELSLPGIGTISGNKNPKNPKRNAYISFFDTSNQLVSVLKGKIAFDTTTGTFKQETNQFFPCLPDENCSINTSTRKLEPAIQGTSCTTDADCASEATNKKCWKQGEYPGKCGGDACASVVTTACKTEQVQCVTTPCPPREVCEEFASPCHVPVGWAIQSTTTRTTPYAELNGSYIVKIQTPQFLRKQIPGIITIRPNQATTLASLTLNTGDINGDNKIDILDYNILFNCFGSKAESPSCVPSVGTQQSGKQGSDLDDDGTIDGIDYNLFIRSLGEKQGD